MRRGARLAAVALLAVLLRPSAGDGRTAPPLPPLLVAGAGAAEITLPPGVPLAGYGGLGRRRLVPDLLGRDPLAFWFKPSVAVHDPIMARALVLQSGASRVLWIAVDLVGPDHDMVGELRGRLASAGFGYDALILSASHTHSGPGGYARSRLFGFLALDRLVPAVRDLILGGMARAAELAERAKAPARVGVGSGEVVGVITSRTGLPLDHEVGVLKVVAADDRPIALLWNYAIHGTILGKDNLLLSGDVTGAASRELERALGVPALYTNGAVGDVSPALRGWSGVSETAGALSREVLRTWHRIPLESVSPLGAVSEPVRLPPPRLSMRNCLGRWIPRGLTLGMAWGFPRVSDMVGVAVGASAWVTIPGELQTRLGQTVKAEGRRLFGHAFVLGVSNDYAGYFLTPDEYRRPSYIACASLYGEAGGQLVAARATEILRRLKQSEDAPQPGR